MAPRSWLFVPGSSRRMMDKALTSGADALILDLEDAVAPDGKEGARETVAAFLETGPAIPCYVRVNGLTTGLTRSDLDAIGGLGAGLVLPKCEGVRDLDALADLSGGRPVLAIATETVRAVRALLSEDWSHETLTGLAWGGEDLAADLGAMTNRGPGGSYLGPFALARDAMLFAAKDAGVDAVDAVFTDFRDREGLLAEAQAAQTLGFTGKMAIHPDQIAPIHTAFTPGKDRVEWAGRVIAAFEATTSGVAVLDGAMLDEPHRKLALSILARGEGERS